MASVVSKVKQAIQVVLPKKKSPAGGAAQSNTFNPSATTTVLARPDGFGHLTDIFDLRQSTEARTLIAQLMKTDPDVSATVHAYLTVANTEPWFIVRDAAGVIDRPGHQMLAQIMQSLFVRNDYTLPQPFALTQTLDSLCEDLRYMILARGAIGAEAVVDKLLQPSEIRLVDMNTVNWYEPKPGQFIPEQTAPGSNEKISLNIPSFFVSFYRRDPTNIYNDSPFVAAINTIAARQQVINDLYRIMRFTGFPRIEIKVVEEVLRKNVPAGIKTDEAETQKWIQARLDELSAAVSNLRSDQAIAHTDASEFTIMNQGGPGKSMDVKEVMEVLNAQNQAALKIMATVIGRGTMGVNTASVEARIFSLSAESINKPIAKLLAQVLTFYLRMNGSMSYVECGFDHVELRPLTELEPQLTVRQDRLLKMLSYGIISDDDFHIEMFNRPKPDGIEDMSGTRFYVGTEDPADDISSNTDALGRSVTAKGSKTAKSNLVK